MQFKSLSFFTPYDNFTESNTVRKRADSVWKLLTTNHMISLKKHSISILLTLFLASNAIAQQQYSVGFRAVKSGLENGFSAGVWYPSVDKESAKKWGPFRPTWAWDGRPVARKFPVILFSHGVAGQYRNHRDTAVTLAKRGYVVIVPQHTKDQWIGTDKTSSVVEHRIAEFSRTLEETVRAETEIAEIIDEQNIGAIGYSLGGLTVLGASGEVPNAEYAEEHCLKNQQIDLDFCLNVSWLDRVWLWIAGTDLVHWIYNTGLTDKEVVSQVEPSIHFRAIALVAPVAAAYHPHQIQNIKSKIAIFRMEADQINRFPFHAEHLHQSLREEEHFYKVYKGAHHFAFISPFPEWLLKEEHIPVAIDPVNFDRKEFIEEINSDILSFFQRALPIEVVK